ncbi:MAG: hypothetical protein IKG70_03865 [Lachnospiraceae bacterium]|nr:hypothetical protein [Lachnospiraceae bacterium]
MPAWTDDHAFENATDMRTGFAQQNEKSEWLLGERGSAKHEAIRSF